MAGTIRVGISGWTYDRWRGVFYPLGWGHRRALEYASRVLGTVEVNGTFYSLGRPSGFGSWYDLSARDAVLSLKGSRYITHMLRLNKVKTALANFWASGPLLLRQKLGPILWQFPPRMRFDPQRFDAFLTMLPRDTLEAEKLAKRHDRRVAGRAWTKADRKRRIRHAVEVRNESFRDPAFVAMLRRHRVALVVAQTADRWLLAEDLTADFVYVRLHGAKELYSSGYTNAELDAWADRVRTWANGGELRDAQRIAPTPARRRTRRDVYVYFDNDAKVWAPFDAMALARRLGVERRHDLPPPPALEKFERERP